VGAFSVSLPDSLLVVGISSYRCQAVDIPALLLHRPLRCLSIHSLCAPFSRTDDGLCQFQGLLLFAQRVVFLSDLVLFVADFVDTLLKGGAYLHTLGPVYDVRTGSYIALSAVAMKVVRDLCACFRGDPYFEVLLDRSLTAGNWQSFEEREIQ
jgi:hypothetical protein